MVVLKSNCTADYLLSKVLEVLKLYKIELDQVYSTTVDNGRNYVRSNRLLASMAAELTDIEERFADLNVDQETRAIDVEEDLLQDDPLPLRDVALNLNASIGGTDTALIKELIQTMVCAEHTLQLGLNDAMNLKTGDVALIV